MSNIEKNTDLLKLKRYFTIVGLSSILFAGILLALFFRHISIKDIVLLGERHNVVLATTVLNSVKSELIDYLLTTEDIIGDDPDLYRLPIELDKAIQNAMADSTVIRLKIYNQFGTVVFSTKPNQIGRDQSDHKQFISALGGQVTSTLIFKDSLKIFQKQTDVDNLVQSYLPVRRSTTSPVYGVFEIYTDVQPVVSLVERTEIVIFLGILIILILLFSFLNLIVRRAVGTIGEQQAIIEGRTKTLELLSAQMLNVQETEKKKIAHKLHEDVAQTLAGLKNIYESKLINEGSNTQDSTGSKKFLVTLQEVIQEVRALAMELRPPSLDNFGLISAIKWLCKEYESVYPGLSVNTAFYLDESELSNSLKTLVYRVIQEALGSIARDNEADSVNLILRGEDNVITLSVEDDALAFHIQDDLHNRDIVSSIALAAMKERTLMSGGTFTIDSNQQGGTIATSSWIY